MTLALMGITILVFGSLSICFDLERDKKKRTAIKIQQELDQHNMQMKLLKMQREKDTLEGNNKCHNVNLKDLL